MIWCGPCPDRAQSMPKRIAGRAREARDLLADVRVRVRGAPAELRRAARDRRQAKAELRRARLAGRSAPRDTRANDCDTRASRDAMLPVVGTMLVGSTNTGRPPSSASENAAIGAKFRSTDRCWFRLSEYVPSTLVVKRPSSTLPFHDRFERTVRCGRKSSREQRHVRRRVREHRSRRAVGAAVGNGRRVGRVRVQSGIGTAGPTQKICCVPLGKPGVVERRSRSAGARAVREHADAAAHDRARRARLRPRTPRSPAPARPSTRSRCAG